MKFRQLIDLLLFPKWAYFVFMSYFTYFFWYSPPTFYKKTQFNPDRSFIRWGDGETLMYLWISFDYQKSNNVLKKYFSLIAYTDMPNIVVWLPFRFLEKPIHETPYIRAWIISRYIIPRIFSSTREYWDAFFFRDIPNLDAFLWIYSSYSVFFIVNQKTYDKILKQSKWINIQGVHILPEINAFDNYESTIQILLQNLWKMNSEKTRILISAWPTAKALVYDLTKNWYIVHDTGAVFDKLL